MASIGSSLPYAHAAAASSNSNDSSAADESSSASLATQSTFLQLLVAQLKNQDPTQPVDGTTFITQLAQFTDVEQNVASRQDLDALSQKFLGTVPSGGTVASGTTTGTDGTGSGTGSGTGTGNDGNSGS